MLYNNIDVFYYKYTQKAQSWTQISSIAGQKIGCKIKVMGLTKYGPIVYGIVFCEI